MEAKFKTPLKHFHIALCELIERGETNVKECTAVGECSDQTIRNWCAEQTRVDEEIAHRLMSRHPKPNVRRALAESRVSGAEFFIETAAGDTDLDKNGRTDLQDVMLAVAQVASDAASELKTLVAESGRGGLTHEESQRAVDNLNTLKREVCRAIGAATKAAVGGRRK